MREIVTICLINAIILRAFMNYEYLRARYVDQTKDNLTKILHPQRVVMNILIQFVKL